MPHHRKWPPTIHRHRSGRAFTRIDGHDYYLGPFGSEKAQQAYLRLLAEYGARGLTRPNFAPGSLTVAGLATRFLDHMHARYPARRDDQKTTEYLECRYALRPAVELYGDVLCSDFGPKSLKAVRQHMQDAGLSTGVVNQRVGRIKRAFKWATEEELLPPAIWHGLLALRRLPCPAGRPKPVPSGMVEAVLPHVAPMVADMIDVQRLTGMRPGELVIMRPVDIDRTADVWVYRPSRHKGQWKGIDRLVLIGPRGQGIVARYLARAPEAFLFSPAEATEAATALRRCKGQKRHCKKRRKARPQRRPGERYTVNSYFYAVQRGCDRAFPHSALAEIAAKDLRARAKIRERRQWCAEHAAELDQWRKAHRFHVHQLRHTAATAFRAIGGLDVAQQLLGHQRSETTQVYAGLPPGAVDAVRRVG